MRRDADIVVVGAGIAGVATARALAGYPGSVLLLEQFGLGHTRGSSHGTSRIFRLNYPDERFVRMALAADAAWRELARRIGISESSLAYGRERIDAGVSDAVRAVEAAEAAGDPTEVARAYRTLSRAASQAAKSALVA